MSLRKSLLLLCAVGGTILTGVSTVMADANQTYTAKGNDTFWTIAHQYHVSVQAMEQANSSVNPLDIYTGLQIKIPSRTSMTFDSSKTKQLNALPAAVPGRYTTEINSVATAYTASKSQNPWGAVDYFGNPLQLGTVAVDPSVIPLGSTLYITGYQFPGLRSRGMICHATDEGGAITGDRVDVFLPVGQTAADNFGEQHVTVYVLKSKQN